jgi:hypothetical protein
MRVQVTPSAAEFVAAQGGTLWVWARRPPMCCNGTPSMMRASTSPPDDQAGFTSMTSDGIRVLFRAPGGRAPDVLEVALHGKRHPRVEAYWDGCLVMM